MRVICRCPQLDKKPEERDSLTRVGEGSFLLQGQSRSRDGGCFSELWLLGSGPCEQQIHTCLPEEQMHRLCRTSYPCGTNTKIKPHPHPPTRPEKQTHRPSQQRDAPPFPRGRTDPTPPGELAADTPPPSPVQVQRLPDDAGAGRCLFLTLSVTLSSAQPFPLPWRRRGLGVTAQKGWEVEGLLPRTLKDRCQKGSADPLYPRGPARLRGAAGRVLATQPGWSPSGAPSLTSAPLIVVAEA